LSQDNASEQMERTFGRSQEATSFLYKIIGRSKPLFSIEQVGSEETPKFIGPLESYKIAMISSKIYARDNTGYYPEEPQAENTNTILLSLRSFDHFDLYLPLDDGGHVERVRRWSEDVKKKCTAALRAGRSPKVRFIIFNELAFPNFWPGRAKHIGANEKRRELASIWIDLNKFLQDKSTRFNVIIIAGTHHDSDTFENICSIYFPKKELTCNHKKITSARAAGENIKVPSGISIPIYTYDKMTFCVLICSDAFDLNIFFHFLTQKTGVQQRLPQIFFVPAFQLRKKVGDNGNAASKKNINGMNALFKSCEQLSLATGSIVVIANQGFDEDRSAVFISGKRMRLTECKSDEDIALINIQEKDVSNAKAETHTFRTAITDQITQDFTPLTPS
jgi:hypothetical protein